MIQSSRSWRLGFHIWVLGLVAIAGRPSLAAGRADTLFKRLPSNASMVLSVENLRQHADEILKSRAAAQFFNLPAMKAFEASEASRQLNAARKQIEVVLESSWTTIRDDLFGDAIVLCLHAAEDRPLDEANGLLLIHPKDRKLLDRVIRLVNDHQLAEGQLESVRPFEYRGQSITSRHFKAKGRRVEYYVVLEDGVFAWSNSEELIRGVVERSGSDSKSLFDRDEFQALRKGLPARSFVSLLISPSFLTRLISSTPSPVKPDDQRVRAVLDRTLKCIKAIGFALEWNDGILLHSHEILDPGLAEEWVKRLAATKGTPDALVRKIPKGSLAILGGSIEFSAAYQGFKSLMSETEASRFELIQTVLKSILLGNDPSTTVLPNVGPASVAYLEAGSASTGLHFDVTAAVELTSGKANAAVAASLDNALRTILALYALEPKRQALNLKIETIDQSGRRMTRISGGPSPFVYALTADHLVIGTSAEAVARFGEGRDDDFLAHLRQTYFPDSRWYGVADLARLAEFGKAHRGSLLKDMGNEQDLDQAFALLEIFPTAFVGMTIDPQFRSVHRVLGLVGATSPR